MVENDKSAARAKSGIGGLDVSLCMAFFIFGLFFRLGDLVITVFDWDNVQYLLSLTHFDPTAHQPHPPGHPIYVFTGWLMYKLIGDGQLAFQIVSKIVFALGASWVYLLGMHVFNRMTGFGAALIYILSPLAGFFVAFPNTFGLEGAMGAAVLLVAAGWLRDDDKTSDTKNVPLWILPWVFGLIAGFRPSFLAFALPGVLYVVLTRYPRKFWIVLINGIAAVLVWLIPLVIMSGGLHRYLVALDTEAEPFLRSFSIENILNNLFLIKDYSYGLLGWLTAVALLYGILSGIVLLIRKPRDKNDIFLKRFAGLAFWWTLPILAFHIFSYVHPGFTVYYLPLVSFGVIRAIQTVARMISFNKKTISLALSWILIIAIAMTLEVEWTGRHGEYFSRKTLRDQQYRVNAFLQSVTDNFPVDKTAVISWEHFRQVGWYLPEAYSVYPQGAYASMHGTDPARSNIYLMHNRATSPPEWHKIRSGPIPPLILPDEVEYVMITPGTYNLMCDPEGLNIAKTQAGEQYLWARFESGMVIAIDEDSGCWKLGWGMD